MTWVDSNILHRFWQLVCVVVLASFVRLYGLEQIDVRFDEASAPIFAHQITQGVLHKVVPFSGSVVSHPPVWLYTLAIPYLFTTNPMVIATFRAMLDVLAIAMTYLLCRRFFSERVGLIAGLSFACAPWAVHLGRKLWTAPLALWSVIMLWGILEVVCRQNRKGWFLAFVGISLAIGTHLAAIYLLPVLVLLVIVHRRRFDWRWSLLGFAPACLIGVAYLLNEWQHGFKQLTNLWLNVWTPRANAVSLKFDVAPIDYALWLSGGSHIGDLTGNAAIEWQNTKLGFSNAIDYVQMSWLLLSVGWVAFQSLFAKLMTTRINNDLSNDASKWVLGFWLLPILFQLRHLEPFQVQYVSALYPAPFVLMSFFACCVISHISHFLAKFSAQNDKAIRVFLQLMRMMIFLGMVMIFISQITTFVRLTDFLATHETGSYRPIAKALHIARSVTTNEVIVSVNGGDPAVNEDATIWEFLLLGKPHRFTPADAGWVICPQTQCEYILAEPNAVILGKSGIAALMTEIVKNNTPVKLMIDRDAMIRALNLNQTNMFGATWENITRFVGYRFERVENNAQLLIVLEVSHLPPASANYHWYNYALNSKDERLAQKDGGGIAPINWRSGDWLVHTFEIPLTQLQWTELKSFRIGSYRYPEIQTIGVQLPDQSYADGVKLVILP